MTDGTGTAQLAERAALLAARVEAVGSRGAQSFAASLLGVDDNDLLAVHADAQAVLRLAEAIVTTAAGEVARRSEPVLPDPLARRLGERSASVLLAARDGVDPADAARRCRLGLALAPRAGLSGDVLPPRYAQVAQAFAAGDLDPRGAAAIVETLDRIAPYATLDEVDAAERSLVLGATTEWSARTLRDVCRLLHDRFDPDGAEPREAAQHARRGIRRTVLADGGVEYLIRMAAEDAQLLDTAIDARCAPRRQPTFEEPDDVAGDHVAAVRDERTWTQRRLDALVDLARDSLRHDDGQVGGIDTTAVVHIPLAAVTGADPMARGWLEDDDATAVSAAAAHRLLGRAGETIPLIVDDAGHPLHLGTTRRLFSTAQRRAMAARDQGCTWPGCAAPPRWCDAAHVVPWARGGPTDLDNGILLCGFHHRRFDQDGWSLHRDRAGTPWFTPPPHIDASRTPRRGGRVRLPESAYGG